MSEQPLLLLPVALELDEQWSFVGGKSNQRWLWLANHHNTEVLAYAFSDRSDATCWQLKQLLRPFNVTKYFTDGLGTYQRLLPTKLHKEGKRNSQKIERNALP